MNTKKENTLSLKFYIVATAFTLLFLLMDCGPYLLLCTIAGICAWIVYLFRSL